MVFLDSVHQKIHKSVEKPLTFEKKFLNTGQCNRAFQKTVKPFLSEKATKHYKINSRDDQVAKKFSEYFTSIPILNMPSNGYKCPHLSEQDPILKILDKYKDHSSIKLMKAKNNSQVFQFCEIDIEEVKKPF